MFAKVIFIFLVLVSLSGVFAAPEAQRTSIDKKENSDLTTVLQSIVKTLQLIAAKNMTVVVLPPPVTVTPNTSIVVVPSPVNVTVTGQNSCVQTLPKRGMHYFESLLPVSDNATVVIPLPNGLCTITYSIGRPDRFRGAIEAFDGYVATQTKLCDPYPSEFCTHTLTISDSYPFARVSVAPTSVYPSVIVSYSCV